MEIEILDLLKEIAHYKSHEAAVDKRQEWQEAAQGFLDGYVDHLKEIPDECPVCGAPVHQEYNAEYHIIVAKCENCNYDDEWDEPDDVNPAAIRY